MFNFESLQAACCQSGRHEVQRVWGKVPSAAQAILWVTRMPWFVGRRALCRASLSQFHVFTLSARCGPRPQGQDCHSGVAILSLCKKMPLAGVRGCLEKKGSITRMRSFPLMLQEQVLMESASISEPPQCRPHGSLARPACWSTMLQRGPCLAGSWRGRHSNLYSCMPAISMGHPARAVA